MLNVNLCNTRRRQAILSTTIRRSGDDGLCAGESAAVDPTSIAVDNISCTETAKQNITVNSYISR